ncbi:MAG: CHAT domain-containing protein [Bacteroidales bacterium]|nr:CHAT domain-containing protein [Bacteroidales bacterium]
MIQILNKHFRNSLANIAFLIIVSNLSGQFNNDSLIQHLSSEARIMVDEGLYYEASENLKRAIDLINIYQPDKLIKLSAAHLNLAIVYTYINKYTNALHHTNKAEEILIQIDLNHVRLAAIYGVTAGIYNDLKDYQRSKRYFSQSISRILSSKKINYYFLGVAYMNLTMLYSELSDKINTQYYWNLTLSIFQKYNFDNFEFYSLGYEVFNKLKDEEQVLFYLNKLQGFIDSDEVQKITSINLFYVYFANYFSEYKNDNKTALSYYKKTLALTLQNFDESHPLSLDIFSTLSQHYYETGRYTQSIEFANRVIRNIDINLALINNNQSEISEESFVKFRYLVDPLEYLIKSKYSIYKRTKDLGELTDAYKHSFYLTTILDNLRWQWDNQSAEYLVGDEDADNYKMGQLLASELYSITRDEKYITEAFEFNERAKGFNLLANLRTQSAMEFGGIPTELLNREADLNQKISTYKELIHDEEQLELPDEKKITNWQNSLFKVSREHDDLIKFFEENYPEYYNLKYNAEVISTSEASDQLTKNDLILEYSIKDSILFTYIITRKEEKLFRQVVDTSFRTKCLDLYNVLTNQSFSHGVGQTYRNYTQLGYELYEILIEPIKEELKGKNIIVIPDEEISYVPFEALISEKVNPEKVDYYRLPYLVKDNGFSTSYSSTIHFMDTKKKKPPPKDILAFAPSYSNISSQNTGFQLLRQDDMDKLIRIPGVKEEVNKISEILDADVYQDLQATETSFKNLAKDYQVLHLAMHTILDDEKPLYSKLAFTQMVDTINDGFLHTYEIYNMQINADLAVLSSCSSGYGNLQEGEGIQSLARGFTYAGCPSILMTLWEVADKSTVEIMERFYYYLGRGDSKSGALHKAKLDFLSNADQLKSNPFFWSSFVLVGDTTPIYRSRFMVHLLNIGILMIPIPIFFFLFFRYRKHKIA